VSKFSVIHNEETEKLPYHINIIDEIHADENAHSRILAKLLQYKKDNNFIFLEEFLNKICGFNVPIENLKIQKVDSCGRIDIPIFDDKYFIAIENKVNGAIEQNDKEKGGGQLARYIENIKENFHIDIENIFIVYTPRYKEEPTDEIWINKEGYSYKSDFENRYKCISYNDEIYKWLKESVKPKFERKDIFLNSAISQYIDYLDGIFSLRKINSEMNMKLQNYIKEELNIDSKSLKEKLEILSNKETELNNTLSQVNQLKYKYQRTHFLNLFSEWENKLKVDFDGLSVICNKFNPVQNVISTGIKFKIENKDYAIILECNDISSENLYIGICTPVVSKEKHQISNTVEKILEGNKLIKPDNLWYGWKYTSSTKNSYEELKELITKISTLK